MALLNGAPGGQPAPDNMDLVGGGATNNETMNGETPPDEGEDESAEGEPVVLLTVMKTGDGKYSLVIGDEPEEDESLAAPEGAGPAAGGTPALPEGQMYDSVGALLKGILDVVRKDQGETGAGDEAAQSSFEDGFASKPKV